MDKHHRILAVFILFRILYVRAGGHMHDSKLGSITFGCPSGSTFGGGYCYMAVSSKMTWKQANMTCESEGYSLGWIEDDPENDMISNSVMKNIKEYWIGLSNASGSNDMVWSFYKGESNKVVSTNTGFWKNLQPDTTSGECVASSSGSWTFSNCWNKLPFVCKRKATPHPDNAFLCYNGKSINKKWTCDGQNDCGDNSDEIKCPSNCSYLIPLSNGENKTLATDSTNYKNSTTCTWVLKAPIGTKIKFEVHGGYNLEQNADYLNIWTGAYTLRESYFLGRVTGAGSTAKAYYSANHFMLLQLSTDHIILKSGFRATYTAGVPELTNDLITLMADNSWKTLSSPFFPDTVPYEMTMSWMISAGESNVVTIEIVELDLPPGGFLEIRDGAELTSPLLSSSDVKDGYVYIMRSSAVTVLLSTGSVYQMSKKSKGFQMRYKKGCNFVLNSSSGEIKSPGYLTGGYPDKVNCEWNITKPVGENRTISLRITDITLKELDLLMIYNDSQKKAQHTGQGFSGNTSISTIFRSKEMFNVMFTSNYVLTEKGFHATYSIDCPSLQLSQWTNIKGPAVYTPYLTEIEISCDTGYSFKQEEYKNMAMVPLFCKTGGFWNVSRIPDCQITYCGAPPAIDNGILKKTSGPSYQSNATYECNGGFTLTSSTASGSDTILCQADGSWQSPPTCAAKSCVAKSKPLNGTINVTGDGTSYGTVVKFSCNPGYEVIGPVTIFCRTNGTWSDASPTCGERCCILPRDIKHGNITATTKVRTGEAIELVCDSGFIINGTKNTRGKLNCTAEGVLLPQLECVDEDDCAATTSPCASDANTYCENTIGSHVCLCKNGYQRSNGDCKNIDECMIGAAGCSDTCVDDTPGYHCTCPTGKQLYIYPGFNNFSMPDGERGMRQGDVYYINHTCVPSLCPKLMPPTNGMVLSQKDLFYYGDKVEFRCKYGYVMNGSQSLTCEASKWSGDVPTCNIGQCSRPKVETNVNRIVPSNNTAINFGDEVVVECQYGSKLMNRTLFCVASEQDETEFELQGDDPNCPVIDCRSPMAVPGSNFGAITKTLLNDSFTFSCENGFTLSGMSGAGNTIIKCQENGRWNFGNLTCIGSKCTDPGTPGDSVQVANSFEVGQSVKFKCSRNGYEPRPSDPLVCEVINGTSNVTWNPAELPTCTDVTPPVFANCTTAKIYIDYNQKVMYTVPTASDNSNSVLSVTVDPPNFKPNTVVSQEMCVTYTATDYSNNSATCQICIVIKPRSNPVITCPKYLDESIESAAGKSVDLKSLVGYNTSKTLQLTYYPSQMISLTSDNLGKPMEVKISAADEWGTSTSCSFLINTYAKSCFRESFPATLPHAKISCTGGNVTCYVTCDINYVTDDGNKTKEYSCTGENNWTPSLPPKACLPYENPEFRVTLSVEYVTSIPAAACISAHREGIKAHNATLNANLTSYCNVPTLVAVESITVREILTVQQKSFDLLTTITADIPGTNYQHKRYCATTFLPLGYGNHPEVFLYATSLICDQNVTSNLTTNSFMVNSFGNLCIGGTQLQDTSYGEQCVQCPPGTFLSNNKCTACADGTYQDMGGQTMCKSCPYNQVPSDDKTYCKDMCPKGYRSDNGLTQCEACPFNCYSVNATTCQLCPDGSSTVYTEAVKNITGCKAACRPGTFSLTGYEPCTLCPLHHYQKQRNATFCYECSSDSITKQMGSNSSSDCINIVDTACNSSETHCNNHGQCEIQNHMKVCNCSSDYMGADCNELINPCASQPCFNGGTCTMTGRYEYNCSCNVDNNCTMTQTSGYEGNGTADLFFSANLTTCEQVCLQNSSCHVAHLRNGYCFMFFKNTTMLATPTSTFFQKTCRHTQLFGGPRCEDDLVNSCEPSTCGHYGMCRDETDYMYSCLCPIVGKYKGPKCELDVDLCNPDPCKNGATCMSFDSLRYQCICPPGYTGEDCDVNINECKVNTNGCLYNGTCTDKVNAYSCTCKSGFTGSNCQVRPNFCQLDPCSNGLCYNDFRTFSSQCVCEPPYEKGSGGKCQRIDRCKGVNCVNGTCNKQTGMCDCAGGFEGSLCQHSIDDCMGKPCLNGANCTDGYNSYTCSCAKGYEGTNCSKNIDDCVNSTCDPKHTEKCVDGLNSYQCRCKPGYMGKNCNVEIDECDSCPCQHDGTCSDLVANYTCLCKSGWTGKNCEMRVDYCKTSLCKNDGGCHNLMTGRFCRCKAGTYGNDCDTLPGFCNITNPCTSKGTCKLNDDGTPKCDCSSGYTGKACQLWTDQCLLNVCKNDGECQMTENGYKCTCKPGFTGSNCTTVITPCTNYHCPNYTKCVAGDYETYCHCPEGKVLTSTNCKAINSDFDAVFDAKISKNSWKWTDGGIWTDAATTQVPIVITPRSSFSVMFWVKFEDDDQTENPIIFQLSTTVLNAITVDNSGIDYIFMINQSRLNFSKSIGDGKWHHIAVIQNFNLSTVIVDAIRIHDKIQTVPVAVPKVIYINVGVQFTGRITAVSLWAGELSFFDIIQSKNSPSYRPANTLIQTWAGYNFGKGKRVYPSAIMNQDVCDSPACFSEDKTSPTTKDCGHDFSAYSPNRIYSNANIGKSITFTDKTKIVVQNTLPSDNTYTWGKKRIAFIATDENMNFATCLFNVYIKYNENCPAPQTTAVVEYCSGNNGDICGMKCSPNTLHISQPTPKKIKCGVLGVYDWMKPKNPFVISGCGDVADLKVKVMASMKYQFPIACDTTFESSLITGVKNKFINTIRSQWSTVCDATCSLLLVTAKCGTQKDIDVNIQIPELLSKITKTGSSQVYTPIQALTAIILQDQMLTFTSIANAELLNSSVMVTAEESCQQGYGIVGSKCVECGVGSFYNTTTRKCELCAVGSYQNVAGQTSCNSCGSGKTTAVPGADRDALCYTICAAGKYYDNNVCKLCPEDFYQDLSGKTFCKPCPLGNITSGTGSNSSTLCYAGCPAGTELTVQGVCVNCSMGSYRSLNEKSCTSCNDTFTTPGNGSKSSAECKIRKCYAGNYRNETTNTCILCPFGTYQSKNLSISCDTCPDNYFTTKQGSDKKTDCKFYCPPGSQVLSAANETCQICDRGYFKDDSNKYGNCLKCPSGNTTDNGGATSQNLCNVKICKIGQYINSSGCQDCPYDTFQPVELPKSTTVCQACNTGTATRMNGSTSISACLPACKPGEQYNGQKCEVCPQGTWNNGNLTQKFEQCNQCPENYTTVTTGRTSEDDCTLLDCDPGYFIKNNSCEPCPFGYYQELRHQNSCVPCNLNLNTSKIAAKSASACQIYCRAGEEGQTNCTKCPENMYKDKAGLSACQNCTGNYTSDASRISCNVLICDRGFYFKNSACIACPVGEYKEKRGKENGCQKCTAGFLTTHLASISEKNCSEPHCVPGKYLNSISNNCEDCPIGSYKDKTGNVACTNCSSDKTTASKGSTNMSNCSIVVCEAGQKRLSTNTCQNCSVGQYQPNRGMSTCNLCWSNQTTEGNGKKSQSDCVSLCSLGEEFNTVNKTCAKCPLGKYKATPGNMAKCVSCPTNKTTNATGATAHTDCNIDDCNAGSYRTSGGCKACEKGKYQPSRSQTSCLSCPSDKPSTESTGANSVQSCFKNCSAGQEFSIATNTCQACPRNYFRDVSTSLYCQPCKTNEHTFGNGSTECLKKPPGTTPKPPSLSVKIAVFKLKFRVPGLNCNDMSGRNTARNAVVNILAIRIGVIQNGCNQCLCPSTSTCTTNIVVNIKSCGSSGAGRKRRSTDPPVEFEATVPDLNPDVVNPDTGLSMQTQQYLNTDISLNPAAYTPSGFTEPDISVTKMNVVCDAGSIASSDGQSCSKCPTGTYNDVTAGDCKQCPINQYQDQEGQTSCTACPGSVKIYTMQMGSNTSSNCVSSCVKDSDYCSNGGTCAEDNLSVYCNCRENFSGTKCQVYTEPESDTKFIIGGAVGGAAGLMVIIILIVCLCTCARNGNGSTGKKSMYESELAVSHNEMKYNRPFVVYDNPMSHSFSKMGSSFGRPNPMFAPDDEAFFNSEQRPFSREEEDSMFRWEAAEQKNTDLQL